MLHHSVDSDTYKCVAKQGSMENHIAAIETSRARASDTEFAVDECAKLAAQLGVVAKSQRVGPLLQRNSFSLLRCSDDVPTVCQEVTVDLELLTA